MGISALSAYRGDLVLAQAAARENVPMIMSGSSLIRLEEVVQANPDAWFQAYLPGDDAEHRRAGRARARRGYGTLVLTVDASIAANRENNVRAGFYDAAAAQPAAGLAGPHASALAVRHLPADARCGTACRTSRTTTRGAARPSCRRRAARLLRPRPPELAALPHDPAHVAGPAGGQGHPGRARCAHGRDSGADGIIVSNHGGRQLDGTVSPLRVLPGIVQACPEVPVMIDSGFRRGTDVLKALALGAKFVFVGRPFHYAAAVAGEAGVRKAITLLREEVSRNMAMLGVTRRAGARCGRAHRRHAATARLWPRQAPAKTEPRTITACHTHCRRPWRLPHRADAVLRRRAHRHRVHRPPDGLLPELRRHRHHGAGPAGRGAQAGARGEPGRGHADDPPCGAAAGGGGCRHRVSRPCAR